MGVLSWRGYDAHAELLTWVLEEPISKDQAMRCAKREPGRSWEAIESELKKLGAPCCRRPHASNSVLQGSTVTGPTSLRHLIRVPPAFSLLQVRCSAEQHVLMPA